MSLSDTIKEDMDNCINELLSEMLFKKRDEISLSKLMYCRDKIDILKKYTENRVYFRDGYKSTINLDLKNNTVECSKPDY